jgi:hypothetical protein
MSSNLEDEYFAREDALKIHKLRKEEAMNKVINDHHDGFGLAESMDIQRCDEVGPGGAHHHYKVSIDGSVVADIQFQKGPRNEEGSIPGVIESALYAIILDRLRSFQAGEYSCRENAIVITKTEEALMWTQQRARNRAKRGVLGTNKK